MIAALVEALAGVRVARDGLSASLDGTEFEAPPVLRSRLYRTLHAGNANDEPGERDPAFEDVLSAATPHRTTPVTMTDPVGGVVVIEGLRVRVPSRMATISAARPNLSPGHFLVDGPHGRVDGGPILRVYLHLDGPSHAPDRWHDVLETLNDAGFSYRAKIVSTPGGYPRRDAMVVYLGPGNWHAAGLVREVAAGKPGVGGEHSLFAHPTAPGIAVAWNPDDPGLSFGEHRARATAEAVLRGDFPASLAECFTAAGIDPANPARNLDSPPLPELGL